MVTLWCKHWTKISKGTDRSLVFQTQRYGRVWCFGQNVTKTRLVIIFVICFHAGFSSGAVTTAVAVVGCELLATQEVIFCESRA